VETTLLPINVSAESDQAFDNAYRAVETSKPAQFFISHSNKHSHIGQYTGEIKYLLFELHYKAVTGWADNKYRRQFYLFALFRNFLIPVVGYIDEDNAQLTDFAFDLAWEQSVLPKFSFENIDTILFVSDNNTVEYLQYQGTTFKPLKEFTDNNSLKWVYPQLYDQFTITWKLVSQKTAMLRSVAWFIKQAPLNELTLIQALSTRQLRKYLFNISNESFVDINFIEQTEDIYVPSPMEVVPPLINPGGIMPALPNTPNITPHVFQEVDDLTDFGKVEGFKFIGGVSNLQFNCPIKCNLDNQVRDATSRLYRDTQKMNFHILVFKTMFNTYWVIWPLSGMLQYEENKSGPNQRAMTQEQVNDILKRLEKMGDLRLQYFGQQWNLSGDQFQYITPYDFASWWEKLTGLAPNSGDYVRTLKFVENALSNIITTM